MGAVENFQSKAFIPLIYFASRRSYKGLDRLANLARARPVSIGLSKIISAPIRGQTVTLHSQCTHGAHESPSAAEAIAAGKCSIALITLAGKPRAGVMPPRAAGAEADFESAYGATTHDAYGMCAMRHMHCYGTTSEQLAWIKVAASHHAQYNPHAMLKDVVTVEDVLPIRPSDDARANIASLDVGIGSRLAHELSSVCTEFVRILNGIDAWAGKTALGNLASNARPVTSPPCAE